MNTEKIDKVIDAVCDAITSNIELGNNIDEVSHLISSLAELITARELYEV